MTTTTTQREIRSPINGRVPNQDSPGVSAPARATIPTTDSDGNRKTTRLSFGSWLARRWAWTARPDSFAGTWAASRVDRKRIPNDAGLLSAVWHVSNWTDRLIMFVLILIAPAFLTGPLRWLAPRPMRRYGLYFVLAALTVALLTGRS